MIKQQSGKWHLYSKDGSKHLGGPYDTREEAEERERQVNHFKHATPKGWAVAQAEVSMVITKASVQADGSRRFTAVVSDTAPDNMSEATSIALFQDWIERVEKNITVPFLPPPRKPFLSISHYSDLDGFGEAGVVDKMFVDGNRFKVSGVFYDNPVGNALFNTVRSEMDMVKRGEVLEKPVRISAAWWDLQHSHGSHIFNRKSLTDACPMCESGEKNKVYLAGQPDHFAGTRVPINPRTSLGLEEKSAMTITRKDDAATIIGEELAEELEQKSKLVGKSETQAAIVVKAKPKKHGDEYDEDESEEMHEEAEEEAEEEMKEEAKGKRKPKGGSFLDKAFTLADARQVHKSASRLELMALVKRNIADLPQDEQLGALSALVDELHTEFHQIKEAVEDLYLLQPEYEEIEEQPMDYLQTFSETVTGALESNQPKEQKAAAIQEALNGLAASLKADLEGPAPQGDMIAAFKAAISPLADQLAQLNARLGMAQQPVVMPTMPTQKSITSPVVNNPAQPQNQLPISPITGQPSELTASVRRSVGIY